MTLMDNKSKSEILISNFASIFLVQEDSFLSEKCQKEYCSEGSKAQMSGEDWKIMKHPGI